MIYQFEGYELDSEVFELHRDGNLCKLEPKAFNVLLYLIENHERIVPKDELLSQLWENDYISDAALNSCIMSARKAVGDSGSTQHVIQTYRSRGYRFVATFTVFDVSPPDAPDAPDADDGDDASIVPAGAERGSRDTAVQPCVACRHPNPPGSGYCGDCGRRLGQSCPGCSEPIIGQARFCQACGYQLVGAVSPVASWSVRPHGPLVGRRRELDVMQALMRQVRDGHGQVVDMVGEAGGGKSRFLDHVRQLAREQAFRFVQGVCRASPPELPGAPIRDMIRQCCGLTTTDSPDVVVTQVYQRLRQLDLDPAVDAPYLLDLLVCQDRADILKAQDPMTIRIRTVLALQRLLHADSRSQPLIVAIEDVQWIDSTTDDCLASMSDGLESLPILFVVTRREGQRPEWVDDDVVTPIALRPLAADEGRYLIQSILAPNQLPSELEQAIVAQTDGNPRWIEEATRWVVEMGMSEPTAALPASLPVSLNDVVMARLEQLTSVAQPVLQTASVLGREFSLRVLREVWDGADDQLDAALRVLESRGWCLTKGEAAEPVYTLAHNLVQEVVYASLPPLRRATLHTRAAAVLERLHEDRLEPVIGALAWHYAQSEHADKAVDYLSRVEQHAAQRGAYDEALVGGQDALSQVERLPAEVRTGLRPGLLLEQARVLTALGRVEETIALLQPLHDSLGTSTDDPLAGPYALVLSQAYSAMGEWVKVAQHAQMAAEAAQVSRDEVTLAQAYYQLAMARHRTGKFRDGASYSRQAAALLEQPEARGQLARTHFVLGLNSLMLGDFATALEAEARAEAIGTFLGDANLQVSAAWATGWIQASQGDWDEALAACQRGLDYALDPLSTAFVLGWMGYAYLESGAPGQAAPCLEQAVRHMQESGYLRMQGLYTTFLGMAYLMQGDLDRSSDCSRQGLEAAHATQDRFGMGWVLRLMGQMSETCETYDDAQHHYNLSLRAFTTVQASFEVARTQLALADVAYQRGALDMASDHIREAYQRFTDLNVPVYVQRVTELAAELKLPVPEAAAD